MISRPSSHPTAHRLQRAYAYRCAMCGFDGRLGRNPVAIEGAHVRWHSQDGPDDLANAIALRQLAHDPGLQKPRPPGRLSTADPAADAHGPRNGTVTCQASPPRGTSTIPRSVSSKFLPHVEQTNSGGGGRTCTALRWAPSSGHSANFTPRA